LFANFLFCSYRSSTNPKLENVRWVDNIKIRLGEMGWDGLDWIGLAQDREKWSALVDAVMNLRVP
jgi:hypothetical protein